MRKFLIPGKPDSELIGSDGSSFGSTDLATLGNGNVVLATTYSIDGDNPKSFVAVTIVSPDGETLVPPEVIARGTHVENSFFGLRPRLTDVSVNVVDKGFVVSWSRIDDDGFSRVEMFQRFGTGGKPVGDPAPLDSSDSTLTNPAAIGELSGGGFIAAYIRWSFFEPENSGVWVQVFNAKGKAVGEVFRIKDSQNVLSGGNVDISAGADGEVIVSFESGLSRAQRLDAKGKPVGEPFLANAVTDVPGAFQQNADLALVAPDKLAAAWIGTFKQDSGEDVLIRTMDTDGDNGGRIFRVNRHTEGSQSKSTIVAQEGGGAVVLWFDSDGRGDDEQAIFARQITVNGRPVGPEVRISPFDQTFASDFAATFDGNGHLVTAWVQGGLHPGNYYELVHTGLSGGIEFGTKKANRIDGTRADDAVAGRGGGDQLTLNGGDDLGYGDGGNDRVDGGGGADFLDGGAGKDKVNGGKGADMVFGGGGNDIVRGGGGADYVRGGAGDDRVFGNAGADDLSGDIGNDTVSGGGGADRVEGDAGNDTLRGNGGDDALLGGDGDDILLGGGGDDLLFGGDGDDRLDGGAGNDTLRTGNGTKTMIGGAGADAFEFNVFSDRIVVTDFEAGIDVLRISTLGFALIDGMTNAEVIDRYGSIVKGDAVLDFENGQLITLEGISRLAVLENGLELV